MNIFALDDNPLLAAQWQHDRHVVKMTLETCQLLSTTVWHNAGIRAHWTEVHGEFRPGIDNVDSGSARLYKSISNPNHPCAVWTRNSEANFVWTWLHGLGLINEYHRRFQKRHGCWAVIASFMDVVQGITGVDSLWYKERSQPASKHWLKVTTLNPELFEFAANHEPFAVCMPDEFKIFKYGTQNELAVASYLNLYLESKIFQDHVKWTRCDSLPEFITGAPLSLGERVIDRVMELVLANREQQVRPGTVAQKPPRDPHPDSLKPVNPKAITRFGTR